MEINDLVVQAKTGNSEAFSRLYDHFAQKIFRFVRIKIQNPQEAEDVVQDVFIKAYRGLAELKIESLNFSAWLYRIAGNTINDYFRRQYRRPEPAALDENLTLASLYSVEEETAKILELETVKAAFHDLSPEHKQLLELRFVQDFTLAETAKILRKTNLAVRLMQYRALKKLKIILNNTNAKRNTKI